MMSNDPQWEYPLSDSNAALPAEITQQINELRRGTDAILLEEELVARLKEGTPLKVKAGFDPTAPDLHLGHTVLLHKLRQFQRFGHKVQFLIGDFTARIGDPTGKNETRPPLTAEQVAANAATYKEQVFKILDPDKTEVVFNSQWLGSLSAADLIGVAGKTTVARMLERDDFSKRYADNRPIALHEFLYPLLQGYDSVALESDVELGGTDQRFNLLMGRELQRHYGQKPQVIMTLPILEGLDGVQKMSKSLGNYIGLTEAPAEMFGKVMSISDELMWRYFELLSDRSLDEIAALKQQVAGGSLHPMAAKMGLAEELIARFHGPEGAQEGRTHFETQFQRKEVPEDTPEFPQALADWEGWPRLLVAAEMCASTSEAMRLLKQNAVKLGDETLTDPKAEPPEAGRHLVRVGKRRLFWLVLG